VFLLIQHFLYFLRSTAPPCASLGFFFLSGIVRFFLILSESTFRLRPEKTRQRRFPLLLGQLCSSSPRNCHGPLLDCLNGSYAHALCRPIMHVPFFQVFFSRRASFSGRTNFFVIGSFLLLRGCFFFSGPLISLCKAEVVLYDASANLPFYDWGSICFSFSGVVCFYCVQPFLPSPSSRFCGLDFKPHDSFLPPHGGEFFFSWLSQRFSKDHPVSDFCEIQTPIFFLRGVVGAIFFFRMHGAFFAWRITTILTSLIVCSANYLETASVFGSSLEQRKLFFFCGTVAFL